MSPIRAIRGTDSSSDGRISTRSGAQRSDRCPIGSEFPSTITGRASGVFHDCIAALPLMGVLAAGVALSPTVVASPESSQTVTSLGVPSGRILFHREGFDGVEHYFSINTDGTDEQALFSAEGCGCAHLSADRSQVLSIGDTGEGTFSLVIMNLDGSD